MSTLDDNLAKRMKVTMGSELDPELATPLTAGCEETPDREELFPQFCDPFKQTNMKGKYSRNTRRERED